MSGLRVLLVTDAVGGVWVYSLELARALKPLGIEAVLAVMGPSPTASQRDEAAGLRLIDTGLPLDWLETSADELRRAGEAIARIASRERADIVQTSSAALLAGVAFDRPCVAVQHSCIASWWAAVKGTALPPEFAWRSELVKRGLDQADAIVAPSAAFALETARIYDPAAAVLTVHNGRRRPPVREIPQGDFVFTAGRLWDEGKNVATLNRAALRIGAPVQAAGSTQGPNGASVQLPNIVQLGTLSPSKVAGVLAAGPVYASAALYEPFGLSVLEAAQAGCALVLSDIPTHRELWGDAAAFVAARDDTGFAAAIQNLLDNPEERQRQGERASVQAARYSPGRMGKAMAGIYQRLVRRGRAIPLQMAGAA